MGILLYGCTSQGGVYRQKPGTFGTVVQVKNLRVLLSRFVPIYPFQLYEKKDTPKSGLTGPNHVQPRIKF